jgi:hypothetical protein
MHFVLELKSNSNRIPYTVISDDKIRNALGIFPFQTGFRLAQVPFVASDVHWKRSTNMRGSKKLNVILVYSKVTLAALKILGDINNMNLLLFATSWFMSSFK